MTIREAIQTVQSMYSKGVQAADTRLSRRLIYNKLITARERVLVQQYNKGQKISQWCYQTIPCLEFISVPVIECPCVPPLGLHMLRSKSKIPAVMSGIDKHLFQSVTSLDGQVKYDETTWDTYRYIAGNKYTKTDVSFFVKGDYIWLTSKKKPQKVVVTVLAADPLAWYNLQQCCEEAPCTNMLDKPFPIDGLSFEAVSALALQFLVEFFSSRKEDKLANTSDDAGGGGRVSEQAT